MIPHERFTPTAVQAYNNSISNASTGGTTQNVALTGSGTNAFVAKKTSAAITIDGSLSDWAAYANYVTFTNATYSNNTVKVSTLWDNTNLYLAYEVTDSQIENPAVDPWDQDAIELYIDAGHEKSTTMDANDYQFIVTALNSNPVYYYWAAVGKTIQKAVTTSGSGYIVEMAVPWAQIGTTPANGLLMAPSSQMMTGIMVSRIHLTGRIWYQMATDCITVLTCGGILYFPICQRALLIQPHLV